MITENDMEHRDETEWSPVPRQKLWQSEQEDKSGKQGGKNIIRKTTLFTFDISNEKLFFIWCEDVCLLASSCILIILGHIYRNGMNTYKHRSQKPRKSANLNIKPKWCWSCRYRYIEYKYMQVHLLMR